MKTVTSIIIIGLLFVAGTLKGDIPAKNKQVIKPVKSTAKTKLVFDVKIHQPPKELVLEFKKLNKKINHAEVQIVEIKNHEESVFVEKDTIKTPIRKKRTFIQKILNKN